MSTTEAIIDTSIVSEQLKEEPTTTESLQVAEATVTYEETETEPTKTTEVSATEIPAKTGLTKRLTIFHPFSKAVKKEEPEVQPTTSSNEIETPAKKSTKGFGIFFSRKATPKSEESTDAEAAVPTELPQTEQPQPMEATNIGGEHIVEDTIQVAVEAVEENEVEQATATDVSNGIKRQSFISKLFGKKKQDTEEDTTTTEATTDEEVIITEDNTNEQVVLEQVAPTSRPSSPLGRLTELFISKKAPKQDSKTTTEENNNTPAAEEEHQQAIVQETAIATASPCSH